MSAEVIVSHPPVTVTFENIVELFFKTFVVIPSLVLISELTSPLSLTPRVSDSNQLEAIDFSNLLDTISVIEKNTRVTHTFLLVSILIFYSVCTPEKEALRVVFLQIFPELTALD